MRIVISRAIGTTAESLWYPYLAKVNPDAEVVVPELPELPETGTWLPPVTAAAQGSPADTVLVGHSLGGPNLLRLLERHQGEPFAGVVLVAAMAEPIGYEALEPFFAGGFDWARIKTAARRFEVLTAADDPVLGPDPFVHVKTFVTELGATATVTAEGGHFPIWDDQAAPPLPMDLPEVARLVANCF